MLQVKLLGQFDLRADGKRVVIPSRAGQSLFAFLVLTAGTAHRREKLAGMLWPETSDENARRNLRQELWRIRKASSPALSQTEYLLAEEISITFNSEADYWLDAAQFERASPADSTSDLISRLSLYRGELLPGFYDDWVTLERTRLYALFENKMQELLTRLIQEQHWNGVLEWGERWIALGQTPEAAYRALLVANAALGKRAQVTATFKRCTDTLRRELDVEPAAETRVLYEELLKKEEGGKLKEDVMALVHLASMPARPVLGIPSSGTGWALRPALSAPPAPGEAPFKGLQYFEERDADLFFGRELLTAKLVAHLRANRFLAVVVGASGSGKSSVVRAGLIPALKRGAPLADGTFPPAESMNWRVEVITPTAHPLEALALSLTRESESVTAAATLMDDLARDPRSLHLYLRRPGSHSPARMTADDQQSTLESGQSSAGGSHSLLVIDQFEELFTLCHDEFEREAFIDNLLIAIAPARSQLGADEPSQSGEVTLVITIRADFYAHLAQYPELRDLVAQYQEYIGPMTADELRRAIEEPARRGNWEFEPGLADLILRDVGDEPGALPLLSHALLETWKRRSGYVLTLKGYADSGGVRGAIALTAETVYQQLTPEQQTLARNVFLRLTELGEGTEDTRRRAALSELIPRAEEALNARAVLYRLAEARLITLGQDTAEVAHEALIREWHTLREWLTQDREGLILHRHLTEAALEWELLEREPGALYRGVRLAQTSEWVAANPAALNELERAFLDASLAQEQREAREREAQRQRELQAARELAEEQKRRAEESGRAARELRRRAIFLAGAFALALVLAFIALSFGDQARSSAASAQANANAADSARLTAESERRLAFSRELSQAAINNLGVDPERSILLALQAVNTTYAVDKSWTPEGEDALHRAIQASRLQLTLFGHTDAIGDVAFSPDGTRLATASNDRTAKVWDALTGKELLTLSGHPDQVGRVAYSADGTRLVTASIDGMAKVWNAETGQELLSIPGKPKDNLALSFGGIYLALADPDNTVSVVDINTGREVFSVSGPPIAPPSVVPLAFSRDNSRLAVAYADAKVRIWDIATARVLLTLPENASALAFSPDGRYLVTGNIQTTAKVWDMEDGMNLLTFAEHTAIIYGIAFGPDGRRVATVSLDGSTRVWDIATGKQTLLLFGHIRGILGVAFSPDGRRLATGGIEGVTKVWDISLEGGKELLVLAGHGSFVRRVKSSPDGSRLATASTDKTAKVWDSTSGRVLLTLSGHAASVYDVSFSPDGLRIATASEDKTVKIWDSVTGRELLAFSASGDGIIGGVYRGVVTVVYSPDGKRLATAGADGTARIWDAATGQEQMRLVGHKKGDTLMGVTNVAFSPDGTRIATSGDDAVAKVWDAVTGRELLALTGHQVRIWGLSFSPDGKRLATSGFGAIVKIWNLDTGKEQVTLSGHSGTVSSIAFSPDGKRVVTSGADLSAKLWDAATGRELLTLTGHTNALYDAIFSPDGTRLITASRDATARVYALRIEELVALARTRVTRGLTTDECQKYLHLENCP